MSAHTPAPWIVVVGSDPRDFVVAEVNGATICEPNVASYRGGMTFKELGSPARDISFEETQANARLIAAAPDLLAALKAITDGAYGNPGYPQVNRNIERMAEAAIAKAEGGH